MINKNKLKRIKFIYYINAKIKSYQVKNLYKKICNYYEKKEAKYTLDELLQIKGFTKEWGEKFKGRKPIIYYVGTDEFQDKSGFLQDLNKVCDLEYFIREDGSYGQYPEFLENKVLSKGLNTSIIINDVNKMIAQNRKPDIILMQSWGRMFEIDKLIDFKIKNDIKIINIGMDERLVYFMKTSNNEKYNRGISGLINLADLMLVTSKEITQWYIKENIPSLYFPLASSLEVYYPMNIQKKYDVGFIGNKYGIREEIVRKLREAGINVTAHGAGWEEGKIPFSENNKFFNECKIVLGIGTVGYCKDFYTMKLRDFDATLSGSVYITHNNKDLHELFEEGKEIILCNNIEEYITKIKYYLNNEEKLKEISNNAYNRASKYHTYEKRFKCLFKEINIQI